MLQRSVCVPGHKPLVVGASVEIRRGRGASDKRVRSPEGRAKLWRGRVGTSRPNEALGAGIESGRTHQQRSGGVESRNAASNRIAGFRGRGVHAPVLRVPAVVAHGPLHHQSSTHSLCSKRSISSSCSASIARLNTSRAKSPSSAASRGLSAPAGSHESAGAFSFLGSSTKIFPRSLRAAFDPKAATAGASNVVGGGTRVQPEGFLFCGVHVATLAFSRRGPQQGHRFDIPMEAPMEQMHLPLLQRIEGPCAVPAQYVKRCATYREAVRLAWALRRVHHMNQRDLAAQAGLRRQHVGDYLAADDAPSRRSLPADKIADFEAVVGNTLVSQWLAQRSTLTVVEQMQATARVAA